MTWSDLRGGNLQFLPSFRHDFFERYAYEWRFFDTDWRCLCAHRAFWPQPSSEFRDRRIACLCRCATDSHRAVYDLSLDKASDRSGITGLHGRMVYEFNGSPCEGYTVNFRFVTRIDTDGNSRLTDQQTTTFEDGGGKTFSFVTKSFTDQALERELKGMAQREPNGLKVEIDKPEKNTLELRKTQFPTQHLVELINKANTGQNFYETNLFDGSDNGDKVMTTTVVVGKKTAPRTPIRSFRCSTSWQMTNIGRSKSPISTTRAMAARKCRNTG